MVPEVITYNAVISACEKGKQAERALEVFQTMQWQGVVPNVITYSAVVSASEKGKQPERALEMFQAMQWQVPPSLHALGDPNFWEAGRPDQPFASAF